MTQKLQQTFTDAEVHVEDVSGECGRLSVVCLWLVACFSSSHEMCACACLSLTARCSLALALVLAMRSSLCLRARGSLLAALWLLLSGEDPACADDASLAARCLSALPLSTRLPTGGCGAQYAVNVVSPDFEGKTLLKANRMVIDVLRSEIKDMHAVRIVTRVPQHKD